MPHGADGLGQGIAEAHIGTVYTQVLAEEAQEVREDGDINQPEA